MLNFTKTHNNRYLAIGYKGTNYIIVEEDGLYYPECDNTEWDNWEEVVAHCNLRNDCERTLDNLRTAGLQAFNHQGDKVNLRLQLNDAMYIYAPHDQTAIAFCEWTKKATECFILDRHTAFNYGHSVAHLYEWDADSYTEMDSSIANIIRTMCMGE